LLLACFVAAGFCYNGVDISVAAATSDLACMVKQGYNSIVVRCFRSIGSVDPNCASNVANAHAAGFDTVDIYMYPSFKNGNPYAQMSALINYTQQNGVKYNTLWLDVEGTWGATSDNVAFFNQLLEAGEHLGAQLGVYTSASQWPAIMGNSTAGSIYPLWYSHYNSKQSFDDFSSFGGWKTPYMKQYEGDQTVCNVGADLNWLPGGNSTTTGPSTVASAATHSTVATAATAVATHATAVATHATAATAAHATSDSTHAAATSGHASNTDGGDSSGKTTSSSTGQTQTSQSSYSGSSSNTAGSGSEFRFLDHAIYDAKLGGNKIPIVQELKIEQLKQKGKKEKEVKTISMKLSEVEDVMEKDAHFKVVEEKSFNKF
jgi:hypothetical protein